MRNRDLLLLAWPRARNRDRLLLAWPRRDLLLLKRPRVRNRDRLLLKRPRVKNRDRLLLKKHLRVNLKRKNISRPWRKGGTPFEVRAVALFRAAGNAPRIARLRRLT